MEFSKYVIFNCEGIESVVLLPDCLAFSEVSVCSRKTGQCVPVAAGKFKVHHYKSVETFDTHDACSLKTRNGDAQLIEDLLWPKFI
jgi:hypothetical protein